MFKKGPWYLVAGDTLKATVIATNAYGPSEVSHAGEFVIPPDDPSE